MERTMAFLIEHYGGDFPLWLAPVQLVLVPIADSNLDYVTRQATYFRAQGLRVEVDSRPERMQAKIRDAELQKIPYVGVCGGRDEEAGTVSLRERHHGDRGGMQPQDIVDLLGARIQSKS
jgi:threonyl-tRNA synthetase